MIDILVSGAGLRCRMVLESLKKVSDGQIRLAGIFDPDREQAVNLARDLDAGEPIICDKFEDLFDIEAPWAMIFSPNAEHAKQIIYSFNAGRHVFAEKPLATEIEQCVDIYKASQESDKLFMTGFVLRYAPLYSKVRELLDSGRFGQLLAINANENLHPAHGAYIMRNWRRHTSLSGPHILEKCCHDLDLMNWFAGSLPLRISSFGKRNFFIPKNSDLENKYPEILFNTWQDPHRIESAFSDDTDLMDNQVAIIEYRNGVQAIFQSTMANVMPERRMLFTFTRGNIDLNQQTGILKYQTYDDPEPIELSFPNGDGHGGGDDVISAELFNTMQTGKPPMTGADIGLESAVTALAIDQAAREKEMINLKPIWDELKR